jgi:hypothetical protein
MVFVSLSCSRRESPTESDEGLVPGKYLVRIRNYTEVMWVGTNSDSIGTVMAELVGTGQSRWIGGQVVPDQSYPYGFYFDPNTVLVAEMTAEGMQATIQQIAQDPEYFARHGWSTELAEHAWFVSAVFLEYRERTDFPLARLLPIKFPVGRKGESALRSVMYNRSASWREPQRVSIRWPPPDAGCALFVFQHSLLDHIQLPQVAAAGL